MTRPERATQLRLAGVLGSAKTSRLLSIADKVHRTRSTPSSKFTSAQCSPKASPLRIPVPMKSSTRSAI